jgi:hypothetical protein
MGSGDGFVFAASETGPSHGIPLVQRPDPALDAAVHRFSALPSLPQMIPISFGAGGSGQALGGASIGLALALALILLFLMPPPLRVSRLQSVAVFWRPQAFVGPLERPG